MATDPARLMRAVVCRRCRKKEEELGGVRMLACGGCRNAHYCHAECQRADWPEHKSECRSRQQSEAIVKEHYGEVFAERQSQWVKDSRSLMTVLVHSLIGTRTTTHIVHLHTEYKAENSYPWFKATYFEILTLEDFTRAEPTLGQAISNLREKTLLQGNQSLAVLVITCDASPGVPRIVPLGVDEAWTRPTTVQDIELYMAGINMGVREFVARTSGLGIPMPGMPTMGGMGGGGGSAKAAR